MSAAWFTRAALLLGVCAYAEMVAGFTAGEALVIAVCSLSLSVLAVAAAVAESGQGDGPGGAA